MKHYRFYVYILANPSRSTLYVGVTNSLTRRLSEHLNNKGKFKPFAGRYYCNELVYFETHQYINNAIAREKQIKRWSRKKKEKLIKTSNPYLKNLNLQFLNLE